MKNSYKDLIVSNMNENGGGLASNITGKFESNRHAIARMEKITFGEAVKELAKKKNGGLKISANELLEIYRTLFGETEWHHAGKLPKQYGGGMKKTYFLNEVPTSQQVKDWKERFSVIQQEKENQKITEQKRKEIKEKFAKKNGEVFFRVLEENVPKFSVVEKEEMSGKYGWFDASYRYNLPRYYSGVSFKSKKGLENYKKL